jgi:hypothetical protein
MMKLNEKGQCPTCKIKPLVYKRPPHKFCYRCDRAFHSETGEQISNWAWRFAQERQEHVRNNEKTS